jgi:hypothetical protein
MRPGTIQFLGDGGKHRNPQGEDCPVRQFSVKVRGVGAVYTDEVECMGCHIRLEATDDGLVGADVHPASKS